MILVDLGFKFRSRGSYPVTTIFFVPPLIWFKWSCELPVSLHYSIMTSSLLYHDLFSKVISPLDHIRKHLYEFLVKSSFVDTVCCGIIRWTYRSRINSWEYIVHNVLQDTLTWIIFFYIKSVTNLGHWYFCFEPLFFANLLDSQSFFGVDRQNFLQESYLVHIKFSPGRIHEFLFPPRYKLFHSE